MMVTRADVAAPASQRVVLFVRDYRRFAGGHLKMFDYFQHIRAAPHFRPLVHFVSGLQDDSNPWFEHGQDTTDHWAPRSADVLFIGGLDWQHLPQEFHSESPIPIINLIQGVVHADRDNPRFEYLKRRAIRICVSAEVQKAIEATGEVNGPVFHVPLGLETVFGRQEGPYSDAILLLAVKAPDLGREIAARLGGLRVELIDTFISRRLLLRKMAEHRVVVTLPLRREGFYLPPLEAMSFGCIVVCPDCVGNRDYLEHGVNGFKPEYTRQSLLAAIRTAIELPPSLASSIRSRAIATAHNRSLETERAAFLNILHHVDDLWYG